MIVCINIGGLHPPYELDPSSYDVHFRCNGRDGPRAVCDSDQPRRLVWPPRPRGFFMRPVGPAALVEWGSLPAVGILVIPLDRFNASLPTEGSDQGDVHDFPPATRDNKHGDTRGVWMPGHRVGVGDLNFAAVRHANVERLERPLILGFLEFVELHFPPPFDSSPRRPDLMCPASRSGSRDRPRESFDSQQPGISVIRHWRLLDQLECLVDEDLARAWSSGRSAGMTPAGRSSSDVGEVQRFRMVPTTSTRTGTPSTSLGRLASGAGEASRLSFTPFPSPIRVMPTPTTEASWPKAARTFALAARAWSRVVWFMVLVPSR